MEPIKRLAERELGVLAVVAAGLVAVALIEAVPDFAARQGERSAFAGPVDRPSSLRYAPVPAPPTAEVPNAREESSDTMDLDQFMGMLEKSAPAPVAKRFADAFLKERPLREAWQRSRLEKGGKTPARDLLRRIAGLPQFRQLMSQFRGEPGFQGAFLQLARNPEASAILRGATGSPAAAAGAGMLRAAVARPRSDAASRQFADISSRRAVSSSPPGGGSLVSGRPDGSPAVGPSDLRDAIASGPAAISAGGASGPGPDAGGMSLSTLDGTSAIRTLAPIWSAGPSRDASAFLDGIFATAPKALRDALLYQCEVNDICDPVEACAAANMFDECVAACADNPVCSGQGILPSPSADAPAPAGGNTEDKDFDKKESWLLRENGDGNGEAVASNPTTDSPASDPANPADGGDAWALAGQLVGGVLGSISGGLVGGALGGPAGALIGGSIGGTLGADIGGFIGGTLGDLAEFLI